MSIKKTYAIFGLGRYGLSVAKELEKSGAEVIAIDSDENIVNAASTVDDWEEPMKSEDTNGSSE